MSDEGGILALNELLERRAQRLAAPEQVAAEEAVLWVARFPVGDEQFALPLEQLRAAVPLSLVTPVPLSAPHVLGIFRFQGDLISALSLASLLGGRGWRQDPTVLLVVSPGQGRLLALDCEQTPRAEPLSRSAIEAASVRAGSPTREVLTPDRQAVQLIDLAALLDRRSGPRRAG